MKRTLIVFSLFVAGLIFIYLFQDPLTIVQIDASGSCVGTSQETIGLIPAKTGQSTDAPPASFEKRGFVPPRTRVHCKESVPAFVDPLQPTFSVAEHLRNTCLFENLYYDVPSRRIFFMYEDANDAPEVLPAMSIMGKATDRQAPLPFPAKSITFAPRSAVFRSVQNTSIAVFRPILSVVSRTFAEHHGHTMFDGVFAIYLSMKRMNLSYEEIVARDVLIQLYDSQGRASMDDRFRLLSSLPLLYGNDGLFKDLVNLPRENFTFVPAGSDASVILIERMVIGLAGFGWFCTPDTLEWRGQMMREFRTYAFHRAGLPPSPVAVAADDPLHVLIIDRIPATKTVDGRHLNYFARWIFNDTEAWDRLAADLSRRAAIDQGRQSLPDLERGLVVDQGSQSLSDLERGSAVDQGSQSLPDLGRGTVVDQGSQSLPDLERGSAVDQGSQSLPNLTGVRISHATLEETTLAYQMQLMQNASVIITLEGCAMENAPFFRDHTVLIALQYNRVWPHYTFQASRHFVEYAQFVHVKMVDTWIDSEVEPIKNSGGGFGVHLYYHLLLAAMKDAVAALKQRRLRHYDGVSRCGSLVHYTTNGTISIQDG